MSAAAGQIFSIAEENKPVLGCTISGAAFHGGSPDCLIFSLAAGTDISAESYAHPKLWLALQGEMTAFDTQGLSRKFGAGQMFVVPADEAVGIRAIKDSVYTEIPVREETDMNRAVKAGDVFELKNLIPFQEGKIVNMDLINSPHMKFVLMSFDAGTGLSEHAAPGEALIFALEGEAVIGYEGKEHRIHAGENFRFDKNGRHFVKADHPFKMALLLQLDAD